MSIKSKAKFFFAVVIIVLTVTTLMALYNGHYHIEGGAIAAIAFASVITSLLPFGVSMHLLHKYELSFYKKAYLRNSGILIYCFCFPVKIWIIYTNIALLINGGHKWPFG